MGILQRIERTLEGAVDDGFARVFGGKVAPQEIENALQREAEDSLEDLGDGALLAPNSYVVVVSGTDHAEMAAEYELNRKAFSKHLEHFIRDNGWQTYGDVVVEFEHSPTLHTGQFRARGHVDPDARPRPPHVANRASAFAPQPSSTHNGPRPDAQAEVGAFPMTQNPGPDPRRGYDQARDRGYEVERGQAPAGYPDDRGYPVANGYDPGDHQRGGYDQAGGYARDQQGYAGGGYDRGGADYQRGYDQPAAYGREQAQPGYGREPHADYDRGGYPPPPADYTYPEQGYRDPGYAGGAGYDQGDYDQGGYAPRGGYDQGYDQGGYPAGGGYGGGAAYDQGYGGGTAAPAYAPASITLCLEDGSNRTFVLRDGSNVIGRGQDAQFRLPDTGVSRRHVEIRWDGQVAVLHDLNSTNGTTVNDVAVSSWELADGDRIRVGHSDITVRFQ
ncbi:FhaA domain-containing protein [Williamsia sp. CHRR-6]|uniref:FhaA domain-containing protein n=1 Tax=Williamsia sp. CHRR-6 TaxID=2835871 RepID=UPI001BDABEEE|nr:FhaA domain-containing protein [Williamsia sp. CHRR-6]MBT0567716.1 DUF3662 and FHA domain-containing protein [Williamsia sp. CHRR-6]